MFDLHTHTVCSDGRTRPAENARLAAEAGLAGIAVTDHDTTAGWVEARAACDELDLGFVPGLELSTEDGGWSVHILGYGLDAAHPELAAECSRLRGQRRVRADRMLERLSAAGVDVPSAAVRRIAGDAPVGRPHLAEAMVEAGVVTDTREAFDRWLAEGRPAYVGKHAIPPERGVALIRAAGGVAVLAHPGLDRGALSSEAAPTERIERGRVPRASDLDLLDRLTDAGLAGVEADHVGHDQATRGAWSRAAATRGLLVTGSSDFHGRYEEERIGSATTSAHIVDALLERAGHAVAPRSRGGE